MRCKSGYRISVHTISRFQDALVRLDVAFTQVSPDEFSAEIENHIDSPAVGIELPFDSVTLPDSVQLDPTPGDLKEAVNGVTPAKFASADY